MSDTPKYSGLDLVAQAAIQNQDNIIERSPISLPIELTKITSKSGSLFGYEEKDGPSIIVRSKGIIKFNPSRSFLKAVGIFYENELPVIGFFKSTDGVTNGDVIKVMIRDKGETMSNELQVVDIKTLGFSQTHNKIYVLAPIR